MISFHRDEISFRNERLDAYGSGFEKTDVDDFSRLSVAINRFIWSPCHWRGGVRGADNFIEARLLGLDFDNGLMTLKQAENVFCDSAHIIGTTRSHQKEKHGKIVDRFRVVLRFERPITNLETFKASYENYISRWDCDSACKGGAQLFRPCDEIISVKNEGYSYEVIAPKPVEKKKSKTSREWSKIIAAAKTDGSRNVALMQLAGHLIARYVDINMAYALIHAFNAAEVKPPLDKDAVDSLIDNAARAELKKAKRRG